MLAFLALHYFTFILKCFPCPYGIPYVKFDQILEYHPHMLQEYLQGTDHTGFMYPRSGTKTLFTAEVLIYAETESEEPLFRCHAWL